jgi:hydrogenase nickel incorporation protein HypA/HybF
MHELSLAENMLAIVEESARNGGFRRVAAIRLEIGRLSCVMPDALRFCFESVTRGSLAEGARLDICEIAGEGRCPRCEKSLELEEPYGLCPDCGVPLEVTAGTEMRVKELEVA